MTNYFKIPVAALILIYAIVEARTHGQIIIVERPSASSKPLAGECIFSKPVSVLLADGTKHTLSKSSLHTLKGDFRSVMQFSHEEAGLLVSFAANGAYNPATSREDLQRERKADYFFLVPTGSIEKLAIGEFKDRSRRQVTVYFRDNKTPPLAAFLDHDRCHWLLGGEEDLVDFGKGRFVADFSFGKVKEITIPDGITLPNVSEKSKVTAVVTEVGSAKHVLTDVRVKDSQFRFKKGDAEIELKVDKIERIDVLKRADLGFLCKVRLKTGAEQELLLSWTDSDICGKGSRYYEVVQLFAIQSIEFGTDARGPK
jgi:hypothetical protein